MNAYFLTAVVVGTFAYADYYIWYTKTSDNIQKVMTTAECTFIYFIIVCMARPRPEVPSSKHIFVLHNGAFGSNKEPRST